MQAKMSIHQCPVSENARKTVFLQLQPVSDFVYSLHVVYIYIGAVNTQGSVWKFLCALYKFSCIASQYILSYQQAALMFFSRAASSIDGVGCETTLPYFVFVFQEQ